MNKMFDEKGDDLRPLHTAMQTKDIHLITNLLRNNDELIRYKNQLGENLLHFAVKYNFKDIIGSIIGYGLDVNSTDCYSRTPLHLAITLRNEDMIRCLLEQRASTSMKNIYGKSPFHLAVNFGDLRIIKLLLTIGGADIMDTTLSTNQTSLHLALRNDDEASFELLLKDYSGNVNVPDVYGETVLHSLACSQVNECLAKLLIDRGADLNFVNKNKESPLHLAIHRRKSNMCKLFLEHGANVNVKNTCGESPLHLAIRYKDLKLVELLLSFGADIDQRTNNDDTMLHVSINYYNSSIVDLLIKNQVNIDAKNVHGLTPFHLAIKIRCMAGARQLLHRRHDAVDLNSVAFGKFVNKKNQCQSYTPLCTAIAHKDLAAVRFLLDNGASFDRDREIVLAVEMGCANIVDLLIEQGANVNATNASGRSLLYVAMKSRDRSKVEMLLHRGADPRNINEIDGNESSLHLAVRVNDVKFVRFLLDIGADVNICDANEMTALCLAQGSIANMIIEKVALLKAHGFFVCPKNESTINANHEFALYFTKCMDELARIRLTRYADVLLIKFLRGDVALWGKYVRKRAAVQAFKASINENRYPTYWNILLDNVNKGTERWRLIGQVKDTLMEIQCFQPLYDVLDDIVDNFNDDELVSFIRNHKE